MSNLYCPKCDIELMEMDESKDYTRYLICDKCDKEYKQLFVKIGELIEIES